MRLILITVVALLVSIGASFAQININVGGWGQQQQPVQAQPVCSPWNWLGTGSWCQGHRKLIKVRRGRTPGTCVTNTGLIVPCRHGR